MSVLVTGAAGFIGFHSSTALLSRGERVVGFDNLNPYYDVTLKQARWDRLRADANFVPQVADLADGAALRDCFERHRPRLVLHLGAQPGVRYSLEAPQVYAQSNLIGFLNLLEACRAVPPAHLIFASTSSVYGANTDVPFRENQPVAHPLSLYAATKGANELMAHAYSASFGLPVTGLRFFTVYGPWGRPDMAMFLFTRKILRGEPIPLYNHGRQSRDFTYVDDIVAGILAVTEKRPMATPPPAEPGTSPVAPYRIYNIGNSRPVALMDYIKVIEAKIGRKAILDPKPMQAGEVCDTFADVSALSAEVGYRPHTPIEEGVARFVDWYRSYYNE